MMKTATAKDLRQRTAAVLDEVRRGGEVTITYRGKSVAVLVPLEKTAAREVESPAFGMWKNRRDVRRVGRWVKELRKPRYGR